jgi:hypothetical protein
LDFYASTPESTHELLQGDVLHPVRFVDFDLSVAEVLDPADRTTWVFTNLLTSPLADGSLVARFETRFGLVLNQGCDLAEHSDADVLVAPIFTLDEIYDGYDPLVVLERKFSNAGQAPKYFYLPAITDGSIAMPRSVAYLLGAQSFPIDQREPLLSLRQKSLCPEAKNILQEKLGYCFGRFAATSSLLYTEDEWNQKLDSDRTKEERRLAEEAKAEQKRARLEQQKRKGPEV